MKRAEQGRGRPRGRLFLAAAVLCLPAGAAQALEDDFEIPLAPLAPQREPEEPEDVPDSGDAETAHEPKASDPHKRPPSRPPDGPSTYHGQVLVGSAAPLSSRVPGGAFAAASLEREVAVGLSLRVDVTGAVHRLAGPVLVPERGLDAGFAEVSRLFGLQAGVTFHPITPDAGLYVALLAGGVLDHTDRRVFSAESRSVVLRPTAAAVAGWGIALGPGQVRMEATVRALHQRVGPEDHMVARSFGAAGVAVGYRMGL